MKYRCIGIATILIFAIVAYAQRPAFLRSSNNVGDYWIYVFDGHTLRMIYDLNARTARVTDRKVDISTVDVTDAKISRPQGGNLAMFHLQCKQPNCVSSDFTSSTFNGLDVFCEHEQDCQTFLEALQ